MVLTLLVVLVVTLLVAAAAAMGTNHLLVTIHQQRHAWLSAQAEAGLEIGRARLNGGAAAYPDSGYVVLEDGVALDLGLRRWLYAGPTGITSGQYGIFGAVVAVVRDPIGGVAVRRADLTQESFAKYAYFTDIEPSNISFGGGDQIWGPVHTNDRLKIYPSGATFHAEARTARVVQGAQYGDFREGYIENVAPIDMPETADLEALRVQAQTGSTHFIGDSNGGSGEATTRVEFIAIDLDNDGNTTGANEGFLRVYRSADHRWVSGDVPSGGSLETSEQCGHYHGTTFVAAADHGASGSDNWVASVSNSTRRCYLGGADAIFGGFQPADAHGAWLPWPGTVSPLLAGRADAAYLFPLSRELNPDFRGVVFVDGKVILSGVLRGRVTVAATDEIIVGDDLTYATDPGAGTCEDILGLFGGTDVIVADNTLNAPVRRGVGSAYFSYDDTRDEFIHGVVLALDEFTVENYANGSTRDERCDGDLWGRGCLFLTGGIIQRTRGAVGTIQSPGGTGYVKRYSYDACAARQPPPYFPTTGVFTRGQYYQVDPVGFDVDEYFDLLTAGN